MDEMQYKLIEAAAKGATEGTIAAGGELAKSAAKSAMSKLKSLLGWKTDPAPHEAKALVQTAINDQPHLAEQVRTILNDYRQQLAVSTGNSAGRDYVDNRNSTFHIQGDAKFGGG
ncbi:MAG: hypothetical protein IBJ18_07265 [Phycisphaerales bacterium]|nr:hypothetical protein [Phycisphaerales bacterium]